METQHVEVKVGAFVVLTVALLIAFVLMLGHIRLSPGAPFYVDLGYAGTLQPGAAVKVSGVAVGQVTELQLLTPTAAPPPAASLPEQGRDAPAVLRASLSLDPAAQPFLHPTSTFAVATQGAIGEAYLELSPGAPGPPPDPNVAQRGIDAPRLYQMATHLSHLLAAGAALMSEARSAKPPAVGAPAAPAAAAPPSAAAALATLLTTTDAILRDRGAAIRQLLTQLAAASGDGAAIAQGLRHAVGEGRDLHEAVASTRAATGLLKEQLPTLLRQSEQTLAALVHLSQSANTTFDPTALAAMVSEATATMHSLHQSAEQLETVVRSTRRGEGTVGGFLQDPEIYDDTKELMRDLKRHPWKVIWK